MEQTNPQVTTHRHFIVKLQKCKKKEQIIRAANGNKMIIETGMMLLIMANFSPEIMEGSKQWNDIFKMLMQRRSCQPRNLYSEMFFRNEDNLKLF